MAEAWQLAGANSPEQYNYWTTGKSVAAQQAPVVQQPTTLAAWGAEDRRLSDLQASFTSKAAMEANYAANPGNNPSNLKPFSAPSTQTTAPVIPPPGLLSIPAPVVQQPSTQAPTVIQEQLNAGIAAGTRRAVSAAENAKTHAAAVSVNPASTQEQIDAANKNAATTAAFAANLADSKLTGLLTPNAKGADALAGNNYIPANSEPTGSALQDVPYSSMPTGSAIQAASTPVTPDKYDAARGSATRWDITDDQTVSGQLNKILMGGSPLMQQAETEGMRLANSRGLLDSSMAVGAAQDAMIRNATPIAQADATANLGINRFNADSANKFEEFNTNSENVARSFGSQAENRSNEFNTQNKDTVNAQTAQNAFAAQQADAARMDKVNASNAQNAFVAQQADAARLDTVNAANFEASVKDYTAKQLAANSWDEHTQTMVGELSRTYMNEYAAINKDDNMTEEAKTSALNDLFENYKAGISLTSDVGRLPDVSNKLTTDKYIPPEQQANSYLADVSKITSDWTAASTKALVQAKDKKPATTDDVNNGFAYYAGNGSAVYKSLAEWPTGAPEESYADTNAVYENLPKAQQEKVKTQMKSNITSSWNAAATEAAEKVKKKQFNKATVDDYNNGFAYKVTSGKDAGSFSFYGLDNVRWPKKPPASLFTKIPK
jgi:hypothetical protein